MKCALVLHQSLSFDTITKPYDALAAAHTHMRRVLIDAGWPEKEATAAAIKGECVMVADKGDNETIEIRRLEWKN